MELVDVARCIHYVLHLQGLPLLSFRYLPADPAEVLHEHLRRFGNHHECLLADERVLIVLLQQLPHPVHGQLHELPYTVSTAAYFGGFLLRRRLLSGSDGAGTALS